MLPTGATTATTSTRALVTAWDPEHLGRAAPHDGTSCRPVPPSPAEFDSGRHWRAARRLGDRAPDSVRASRVGVGVAVLSLHVLVAALLERSFVPIIAPNALSATHEEPVLLVRLQEPRPPSPAAVPAPPSPSLPPSRPGPPGAAAALSAPAPAARPDSLTVEPDAQAQESTRSTDPLDPALWSPSIEAKPAVTAPRTFDRPPGPSVAELLDRPAELPGTPSPLAQVWAPEGESLAGEFVRRTTVVREFKNRWGGRFRCAISPVTFGLPVCAFGIALEPLPNAPLAPNEAPRDGRLPLGAQRP